MLPSIAYQDIEELRSLANSRTFISPRLDTYIMNLLLATRYHSRLEGTLLGARCTRDVEDFVRSACVLFNVPSTLPDYQRNASKNGALLREGSSGDAGLSGHHGQHFADISPVGYSCTEKDVARVFAGVLAHRLAVRSPIEGPLRSIFLAAVDDPEHPDGGGKEDIMSVHSVLAGILRTV